jgi:hypothetical protein
VSAPAESIASMLWEGSNRLHYIYAQISACQDAVLEGLRFCRRHGLQGDACFEVLYTMLYTRYYACFEVLYTMHYTRYYACFEVLYTMHYTRYYTCFEVWCAWYMVYGVHGVW